MHTCNAVIPVNSLQAKPPVAKFLTSRRTHETPPTPTLTFTIAEKTACVPAPVLAFHMSFLSFVRGSASTTRSQGLDPIFVFHFIRTNETFALTLARQWRRIFRQHPLDISCGGRSLTPKRVFLPHNSKLIQIERVISIRGSSCDNVHARQAEAISLAGTRANRGFFFPRHATLDSARTAKTKLRHSPHAPTCYSLAIYLRLAALIAKLF